MSNRCAGSDRGGHSSRPAYRDDGPQHAVALVVGQELCGRRPRPHAPTSSASGSLALDLDVVPDRSEVRHHNGFRCIWPNMDGTSAGLLGHVAPVLHACLMTGGVPPGRRLSPTPRRARRWCARRCLERSRCRRRSRNPKVGGAGRDPMPTMTRSASSSVPSARDDLLHALSPRTSATPTPVRVDTLGTGAAGADQCADLLAEDRGQRLRLRLDQRDVDAEIAQARGDLTADKPAPITTAPRASPASLRSAWLSS